MSTQPTWRSGCLIVVGLSHHEAPLEIRERLAFDADAWYAVTAHELPTVLLSTCNRVEVYAWAAGKGARAAAQIVRGLARAAALPVDHIAPHVFTFAGRDAILHLVRVAAGLDSLVVGEEQIRGQVRDALRLARQGGDLPTPLSGVFDRALEGARHARGHTLLGHHPSVAAAAVEVAHHLPPLRETSLADQSVLVLGAGAMAKSAARALVTAGAQPIFVNRTPQHAQSVVRELGLKADVASLADLPDLLERADLVVAATAARQPVVDLAVVEAAMAKRGERPLVLVDIAVPRDVDPRVRALRGVHLINLDDLERLCPVDVTARRSELQRVDDMAGREADSIANWLRVRAVSPAIAELRDYGERIRARELRRSARRLGALTDDQRAAVDALTESIVNQLLHGPTVALRESAVHPRRFRSSQAAVRDLLRVDAPRRGAR